MKTYKMTINDETYEAKIIKYTGSTAKVNVNGVEFFVEIETDAVPQGPKLYRSKRQVPDAPKVSGGVFSVEAPIPGQIHDIRTSVGDRVASGDVLVILEAMKMESEIQAPYNGVIESIKVSKGDSVQEGDVLVGLKPDETKGEPKKSRRKSDKIEPKAAPKPAPRPVTSGKKIITSPLPGTILDLKVQIGSDVNENDIVLILEAMKMESEIVSDFTGKVKNILVSKGQSVQEGQELIEFE